MSPDEINQRFGMVPVGPRAMQVIVRSAARFTDLALALNDELPESREKSLAMTALEVAQSHAAQAAARHITK